MACVPGASHQPKDAVRGRERKYWLFEAAWAGCLTCVKHFLEYEGVNPQDTSNSSRFSALDWALYGQEQGQDGADEVVAYLNREWPGMPRKKKSRKNPAAQPRPVRTSVQQLPKNARVEACAKGLTRGQHSLRTKRQVPRPFARRWARTVGRICQSPSWSAFAGRVRS